MPLRSLARQVLCAAALACAFAAHAGFPQKPVRLIVPFAAGATSDVVARFVAIQLKDRLGQPVVVDNRPGATGIIAAQALLASPADGHTLMLQSTSIAIAPSLNKLSFDIHRDLAPIARIAATPYVFVVGAGSPFKSMDELIAGARQHPGKISCGTYGVGSPPHMALEMLNRAAAVRLVHVPYRTPTLTELASGVLDCAIETPSNALIHERGRTGRALGVTWSTPLPSLPGAQPIAARYPNTAVQGWIGIFAPARTPQAAIAAMHKALNEITASAEFTRLIDTMGLSPVQDDSPEKFSRALRQEEERFSAIIKEQKISHD